MTGDTKTISIVSKSMTDDRKTINVLSKSINIDTKIIRSEQISTTVH
jgi:hypothetical protein